MKTKILSITAILLLVLTLGNKTFAATQNNDNTTVLTNISNISKIEVHGNVQLYLTSGDADKVKVYDSYYSQNALVQEQDGVLRISSYKADKLVVWVTVNDLRSLSAFDNAVVETFGKFSAPELTLNLSNNASANFDIDCIATKIALNDSAKANISGTTTQNDVMVDRSATLNTTNLFAQYNNVKRVVPATIAKNELEILAAD